MRATSGQQIPVFQLDLFNLEFSVSWKAARDRPAQFDAALPPSQTSRAEDGAVTSVKMEEKSQKQELLIKKA